MASTASQLPPPGYDATSHEEGQQHFILIEPSNPNRRKKSLIQSWNEAISSHFSGDQNPPFTVIEGGLTEIQASLLECDCMVSPANSFGIMDGGYDHVLSKAFEGEPKDYWRLSNHVQAYIKDQWHGFLPPASCIIVPLPADLAGANNAWGAKSMAVLPTMRTPENVTWHKDLVYSCMWSLQVAVENWNKAHPEEQIRKVLMTGLATGCGMVGPDRCAQQMALAVRHFRQPISHQPRWKDVVNRENEVVDATLVKT